MAVIKCSNCENEILDSEIVCPYCDFPVDASKKTGNGDVSGVKSDVQESKSSVKIASIEDFEKEKSELLKKLEDEAKILDEEAEKDDLNGETLRISKTEIIAERSKDSDLGSSRDVSATAAKIKIDKPNTSKNSAKKGGYQKKSVEKSSKIVIIVLTVIGIIAAVILLRSLWDNSVPTINKKLEGKQNKSAKVVKSDSQTEELGYKFEAKNTLVIMDSKTMDDYSPDEKAPWADRAADVKHIRIEDSVEYIGAYAFYQFTKLEDVILGKDVREIGESAFYGCTSLKSVKGRGETDLKIIGDYSFTKCAKLEKFVIDSSLKSIGEGAFKGCSSLVEMNIPSNVNIGSEAFIGCSPDFTILCSKTNERAIEYAKTNGINIEFTDGDEEPEEDDSSSNESSSGQDNSEDKKEEKKNEEKKSDKTNSSDEKKDQSEDKSTKNESNSKPSAPTSSKGRTKDQIFGLINEKNAKLADPNLSDAEKSKLTSERDSLLLELDEFTE